MLLLSSLKKLSTLSRKKGPSIPKSTQNVIPINRIWPDGIFFLGDNRYSKTYHFTDINYSVSSPEDMTTMFLNYSAILNSLEPGVDAKITINNHQIDRADFNQSVLLPLKHDGLDHYRQEINHLMENRALVAHNHITQDKYITVTVEKRNIDEARTAFQRIGGDLSAKFKRLESQLEELDTSSRLKQLYEFLRPDHQPAMLYPIDGTAKKGHSFKDAIAPDSMSFKRDYFEMDGKVGRVLYLREYPSYLRDSMVAEISDIARNMMISIDIVPKATEDALRQAQNKLLSVESNITRWQHRQTQNANFSALIPFDLEQQRQESREFLSDLTARDQRMMFVVLTIVHLADSKEQLDQDTESILSVARKDMCQVSPLSYQQLAGLQTVLPIGVRQIHALRTMTTEATSALMPFRSQELSDPNGLYYGQNAITGRLLHLHRQGLLNGNGFYLGVSGSGKSMACKIEAAQIILNTNDEVLFLDPEGEYSEFVRHLSTGNDCEVIDISTTSKARINAMDISAGYSDNPIAHKAEFLLSLCEQCIGVGKLNAMQKSIIDRCCSNVYRTYVSRGYQGRVPTLKTFYKELQKQPEAEAKEIALALELFVTGNLNIFSQPTNIRSDARITSFCTRGLGKGLKAVGMLVMLDAIENRIALNERRGVRTWVFIDEIFVLFSYGNGVEGTTYSSEFLLSLWKTARKHNAILTGISQNISELLQSEIAKTMLGNSEFLVLLNQAGSDRVELARLLQISDTQLGHITNSLAGCGLLKCGPNLIPFTNVFPQNTELYRLMSTKPNEDVA